MNRKQVANLLRDIAHRVESGDSVEGSIQWTIAENYDL